MLHEDFLNVTFFIFHCRFLAFFSNVCFNMHGCFCSIWKYFCGVQAIRVFFLIRNLSFTLRQESESQLPLTRADECVNVDDVLDLSKCLLYRICSHSHAVLIQLAARMI